MKRRDLLALAPAVLLPGCSSAPTPKKPEAPPEPVTGLHALYQMYQNSRIWAQDLQVIRCSSIHISQVQAEPGKAAAWQAVFASPSLNQQRAYTMSVYDASTSLRSGIFPDSPGPLASDAHPFLLAAARTDTDAAWQTALTKGAKYNEEHPGMVISYILEMGRRINEPVWRVIWGESPSSSVLSVLVDASTGAYLETEH
jgi:hypothetical protein